MPGFGWLHLTDLHAPGAGGFRTLWPNVEQQLLDDLSRLHGRAGPWDAVFFTGDLTQRGTDAEFSALDEVLGGLWDHLRSLGSNPVLLPVPGNHDLVRPEPRRPEVRLLSQWGNSPDVQQEFWTDPASPYRAVVNEAFKGYEKWFNLKRYPQPDELSAGLLPGDRAAVLERDGLRVGVVGLNTAFLQLSDGPWQGRLSLSPAQLHAATGGNGATWTRANDLNFLLSHHGPLWLDPPSVEALGGEIAPPGRFLAHLFGHMHDASTATLALGGAQPWRRWQGTSLFGLEGWGPNTERRHGYTAGRVELEAPGRIRVRQWPRAGVRHQAGFWQIVSDQTFVLEDDSGTPPELVALRPRRRTSPDSGDTRTLPSNEATLSESVCRALAQLADQVHDEEVAQVSRLVNAGEYVAMLAPTGFRLGLALRSLAERTGSRPGAVAFRITPLTLADTLDDWLDHLLRELSLRVKGLTVNARGNRLLALLYALQDSARTLSEQGNRLIVVVDPVESFAGVHRERLVRVLQVLAQLAEERTNDPALEAIGVGMAGGEELHRILAGRVPFSAELSPVRASQQIVLDPVKVGPNDDPEVRRVVDAVGGHPELVRWASGRGGRVGGRPEDELPWMGEQVQRLRQGALGDQVRRLLSGEAAAWRDPDPALRWSGWIRTAEPVGWLGPVLESLARRAVGA